MNWTVNTVKEELPDVKVKVGKGIFTGRVRGRKLNFAKVYVPEISDSLEFEVSWQTLANCLNNNRPIIA